MYSKLLDQFQNQPFVNVIKQPVNTLTTLTGHRIDA